MLLFTNILPPIDCAAEEPFNSIKPVVALNTPLLIIVPATCSVVAKTIKDALALIVIFLTLPTPKVNIG